MRRPLRIGIWFHYGVTLPPDEGIGVFSHNLAAGLLELDEQIELSLLIRPEDEKVVAAIEQKAPDRVRLLPSAQPADRATSLPALVARWRRLSRGCGRLASWCSRLFLFVQSPLYRRGELATLALLRRASYGKPLAAAACVLFMPLVLLTMWLAHAIGQFAGAASRTLLYPLASLDGLIDRISRNPRMMSASLLEVARSAGCDVWVFPYIGFPQPVNFPAVFFIHDLIPYHFPEGFDGRFLAWHKLVVPARAAEATLVACMSDVIKEQDLVGILDIPRSKIRVVPAAAPGDLPVLGEELAQQLIPRELKRPYLFYPAAFRRYKNHEALIRTLAVLRDEYGEDGFDVVFTGPNVRKMPQELERLAQECGVADRVRVLGRVDRLVLAALYQQAFATLMPSLYEECAFPVYEAVRAGSPVACSDLPAMREQFRMMGDSMLYFDPENPKSIADAVRWIQTGRERIRSRQQKMGKGMWTRTWKDVASDWLHVFREAADLDSGHEPLRRAA